MKIYVWILNAFGLVAGLLVGAMVILVSYDVVARNVGMPSFAGAMDVTEHLLPVATCIAAPWLMYNRQHIRLDVLNALSEGVRFAIFRIAAVIGCVVSVVIACYSVAVMLDAYEAEAVVMKSIVFPEWFIYIPFPACFALLAIECGRQAVVGERADAENRDSLLKPENLL
ncbi:TRAP-type C4-dicarboxylate transport system permease small subunit [Pigmentiphaga kullae]|uniref:TRAP transporter small permease protein n=1 Tax=Pigmentiphaga kullae TaxID=151784 RepID=A0A4Q7N7T7_9BURK|nr:TRAP-type C4-dicarboxylate transport system permease small subunit [Pigmentiphaga kullae]